MASEHKRDNGDSGFSFGVRELRQAQAAQRSQPTQRPQVPRLENAVRPVKSGRDSRGNNPYDTSGGFDRSRNWTRVGKR